MGSFSEFSCLEYEEKPIFSRFDSNQEFKNRCGKLPQHSEKAPQTVKVKVPVQIYHVCRLDRQRCFSKLLL